MTNVIQEIKEKTDIADFIGSYIKLIPAGRNLKAACPFHEEKTPSFIVSPERQIWHCFGCNSGGDAIKFLMQYENLEFHEAIRILAEKAGVQLTSFNFREQKEIMVLYDLNEKAKNFFRKQLENNKIALEYLRKRGLKSETIDKFELGFSPGGDSLTVYLVNLGYDMKDIQKAGLIVKTERGTYRDKFYERIIFPIPNPQGKIAGFTGRLLPEKEAATEAPKYLNSPETPIFNKSKTSFSFNFMLS